MLMHDEAERLLKECRQYDRGFRIQVEEDVKDPSVADVPALRGQAAMVCRNQHGILLVAVPSTEYEGSEMNRRRALEGMLSMSLMILKKLN